METSQYIFYLFAGLTSLSALSILFTRNVLHAAVGLMGTLLGIAALFVFAGADFLAVTQIVIYVGGILILIVFGIMFSNRNKESIKMITGIRREKRSYILGLLLFFFLLLMAMAANHYLLKRGVSEADVVASSTVNEIGVSLMTQYIVPFELAGLLLLIALIGAAYIVGRKEEDI